MKTFAAKDFLGATSRKLESNKFKISIVNYHSKVSEDWHWHEKFHISSILRGGNLESRKKEDIQVTSGKVMVYDQGEIHRNRFTAHPSRNLNIELEEGFFVNGVHFSNLKCDENTQIEFYRIYLELLLNDQYSEQSITDTLTSLFWQEDHGGVSDWIGQLETILQDRWTEFPSLEDLSNELKVHPITISKYFAKYKGITLSEYMRKLKVRRAIGLLINSTDSITEIAFQCGFSDQSHLTRLTKHYTGFTPGALRSQLLG